MEDQDCAARRSCSSCSFHVWRLRFAEFAKSQPVLLTSRRGENDILLHSLTRGREEEIGLWAGKKKDFSELKENQSKKLGGRESPEEKVCGNSTG